MKKENIMNLNSNVLKISDILKQHNFKAILVGGMVRDYWMNQVNNNSINKPTESKDVDIEVYGVSSYNELNQVLSICGKTDLVGEAFGVIKLKMDEDEFDISLPRLENNTGNKHTDVQVTVDSSLSFSEAFKRRDFTMNAIGYDIQKNEFIDPYGGIEDIQTGTIQIVDKDTFIEDPLRVYRAIQFVARFNLKIESNTLVLLKEMVQSDILNHLPKERIFEEFNKLLLKSKKPSIGFELMKDIGILEKYFPEVFKLIGIEQDPKWHPEGDVWIHTMMVIDKMSEIMPRDVSVQKQLIYMYSALAHDFGKALTTEFIDNKWTSRGHEEAGLEPTISFLSKLTNDKTIIDQVGKLVIYHVRPAVLYTQKSSMGAIKRLARKVNLLDVVILNRADHLGRTTEKALKNENSVYDYFIEIINNEKNGFNNDNLYSEPKFLTGNDLINLGLKPGKMFKDIIEFAYVEQLEGNIKTKDEALALVRTKFSF